MDLTQIREMLARDPFLPFRIKLADGTSYDVRNPGLVVPQQTQMLVCFPNDDRYAVVHTFQITALETLPPGGRKPRRRKSA